MASGIFMLEKCTTTGTEAQKWAIWKISHFRDGSKLPAFLLFAPEGGNRKKLTARPPMFDNDGRRQEKGVLQAEREVRR